MNIQEYYLKKAKLDDDFMFGYIDEIQYYRESLDLDLKYGKLSSD